MQDSCNWFQWHCKQKIKPTIKEPEGFFSTLTQRDRDQGGVNPRAYCRCSFMLYSFGFTYICAWVFLKDTVKSSVCLINSSQFSTTFWLDFCCFQLYVHIFFCQFLFSYFFNFNAPISQFLFFFSVLIFPNISFPIYLFLFSFSIFLFSFFSILFTKQFQLAHGSIIKCPSPLATSPGPLGERKWKGLSEGAE